MIYAVKHRWVSNKPRQKVQSGGSDVHRLGALGEQDKYTVVDPVRSAQIKRDPLKFSLKVHHKMVDSE